MNKLIIAFAVILTASSASAQSRRSLKDIDRELKQTKSTATAVALIESIGETVPQTDEEVTILGLLMDKYPVQGQKALAGIKDPKLAGAIQNECDREAKRIKAVRAKGDANLTDKDRQEYLNAYLNSEAVITKIINLNDKSAIPLLRGYLKDEDLSRFASIALGRLGDTQSLDTMVDNMGHGNKVDLSGYGDEGLSRAVEELHKPGIDNNRKEALLAQIKGSKSPGRKRLLQDLALNDKDPRIRDRSGLSLLNSIMVNPEPGDNAFIAKWVDKTKNDETGYWAVTSIRVSHGNGAKALDKSTIALLVDVLRTSTYGPTRGEAAESLGMFKAKESLPYLKECITKDSHSSARGNCMESYWKITGKVPAVFHPDDVVTIEKSSKDTEIAKTMSGFRKNDPIRLFHEALMQAFEEYKQNHK